MPSESFWNLSFDCAAKSADAERTYHEIIQNARPEVQSLLKPLVVSWGYESDTESKSPIIDWHGRKFVRVSIQGYNTRREVDALVKALEAHLTV